MSETKRTKFNKFSVIIIGVVFLVLSIGAFKDQVLFWINKSEESTIPIAEISSTIEQGDIISFSGDFNNVNVDAFVNVDDVLVGNILETGLFNTTFTFSSNDNDILYLKSNGETVKEDAGGIPYTAYDMNDSTLGYSEEMLDVIYDGSRKYVTFFYDNNKEIMPYYILPTEGEGLLDDNTYSLVSDAGEVLFDIGYSLDYSNGLYTIYFVRKNDFHMPIQDIIMMFCTVQKEIRRNESHNLN